MTEENQVVAFISENTEASRYDIEHYLGMSSSSTIRLLRKLREEGSIRTKGKGKNTRYWVE